MHEPPRQLVGLSWMVARTGLHRTTITRLAVRGAIPGATKPPGLDRWLFDPDLAEAWLAAGRPTPQAAAPTGSVAFPESAPRSDHGRRDALPSSASNTPPLVVLFKNATHRGIYDEEPLASPAPKRRPQRRVSRV